MTDECILIWSSCWRRLGRYVRWWIFLVFNGCRRHELQEWGVTSSPPCRYAQVAKLKSSTAPQPFPTKMVSLSLRILILKSKSIRSKSSRLAMTKGTKPILLVKVADSGIFPNDGSAENFPVTWQCPNSSIKSISCLHRIVLQNYRNNDNEIPEVSNDAFFSD